MPFTDLPDNVNLTPAADRRIINVSKIAGQFTPRDQFFTTQHYGHPDVDPVAYRLKVSGLVSRPLSLSLDELKKMGNTELVFGFECSGNRRPLQGLSSNGLRPFVILLETVALRQTLKAKRDARILSSEFHRLLNGN